MAKGLVIVESPAKAKTIQKYLGSGYEVEASLGHIKDLPKKSLGVDLDNDFATEYVVIPGKEKVVAKLKKLAKSADAIYLAPDPDREGEAIAAHLAEELGGDSVDGKRKSKKGAVIIRRVTFNEITKRAVQEAFQHPRDIDTNLVDAQQTRRVLDRLVGYQISPLAVGQSAPRLVSRTRADRRSAADCRTRARDQSVRQGRILDDRRASARAEAAGVRCPLRRYRRREDGDSQRGGSREDQGRAGDRRLERPFGRYARAPAQSGCTVHHQQVPAGRFAQAALQREARHDDRPAPV